MNLFYVTIYLLNGNILSYTKFSQKDAFMVKKIYQDNLGVKEIRIEDDRSRQWLFNVG